MRNKREGLITTEWFGWLKEEKVNTFGGLWWMREYPPLLSYLKRFHIEKKKEGWKKSGPLCIIVKRYPPLLPNLECFHIDQWNPLNNRDARLKIFQLCTIRFLFSVTHSNQDIFQSSNIQFWFNATAKVQTNPSCRRSSSVDIICRWCHH